MLANLLQTSVLVADTLMIGRLGPVSIAAVGLSNSLRFFIFIAVVAVSGGAISLIAQARGSRDPLRMSRVAKQSILTGLMLSVVMMLVGFISAKPLLHLMNNGGMVEAEQLGFNYLFILFIGMPFLVLNMITDRLMQGAGDALTPLWITAGMVLLNILLNYLFIFGWAFFPAMGIAGAALATVIARAIAVFIALRLFLSGKNAVHILSEGGWKLQIPMVKDLLAIGIPSGLQGVFRHAGNLLLIALLTATELGTLGAAVLTIGFQIEQLAIQPTVGLNVAGTSLVGQQIGKWQLADAYQRGNVVIGIGMVFMLLAAIPMLLFPEAIILLFDPSANAIILAGGVEFFRINAPFLPIAAVAIIIVGTLRGAGDTQPAMRSALINRSLLTAGFAWLLAFPLEMGSAGIWWGVIIGRLADTLTLGYIWWRRQWPMVALRKTAIYRTHLQHLSAEELSRYLRSIRQIQMQEKGMLEIVQTDRIIYDNGKHQLQIRFDKGYTRFWTV
jgi:putative MATE family efflux protein